ncbi:DUF1660 family phage protein [Microscilla marina]|uniref:Uncharacterized protein n=1 Tax=Microscilla marina ATCC 23134 TaxID=313606 RepID=A1ZIQ4_MICM2|nr:DUF1660 family phage protein [Microscilla marina]EAY29922.1 hypothetical protein M23134_05795 [Microscilla marina ATCC 23134]
MNNKKTGDKDTAKGKPTPLACKIWGHKWQGDSLKRRCTRCGKTQVSRYSVEGWIDV